MTLSNILRKFSPAIIGIILSLIGIIYCYAELESSGGWSYIGVVLLVTAIVILIILDLIAKSIIKNNTLYLWIVEIVCIVLGFLIWNYWIY